MSENRHHYTAEDLDLNQAHTYVLLLQVDANSFNYAITSGNRLLAWGEGYSLDELRDPQLLRDILTANYRQVITGLHTTGFTLFPKNLFDKDRLADLVRLLDVSDTEKVNTEVLDNQNVIIYKVDETLTYAVKDLDNQKAVFVDTGWIKAIANNYPLNNGLYLNIANDVVSVANFTYRKLRFYNHFTFKNHEELAYFCALVATELEIKPENAELMISGDINDTDRYFTYLKDFFGEITLNNQQVLTLPGSVESHKVLSIAALRLCV